MASYRTFAAGLALGLLAGIAGTLLIRPEPIRDAALPAVNAADARSGSPTGAMLEVRGASASRVDPAPLPGGGGDSIAAEQTGGQVEAARTEADRDAAYRAAREGVIAKLRSLRDGASSPGEVTALLQAFRKLLEDPDPRMAQLGTRALVRLAGSGVLRGEEVDGLAKEYRSLPAGHAARAGLAGAVALAWASDDRLSAWLEGLPATEEPDVRATVVEALDESASAAYREYLLLLTRVEKDADVLEHAWHEDPITVAMTREWAPRLVTALERRVDEGGLPPVVRGRALFAIGLAAVHEPAAAAAAIGRIVGTEADAGVRAYGQAVLGAIEREEANVQTLDRLWAEHRSSFAK